MHGNIANIFDLNNILLTAIIFVPLERLLPMHMGQKVFRRAWKNDVVYLLFNGLWIKFLRIGLGPLRYFLALPEFHHWHHSSNRLAYNKNLSGQLSFIDALFGTLYLPRGHLPDTYGIDNVMPGTY